MPPNVQQIATNIRERLNSHGWDWVALRLAQFSLTSMYFDQKAFHLASQGIEIA